MKVYISADLEGVTGATVWDEVEKGKPDYAEFREQMTAEVNAACHGALDAGAAEIWVQDAHESGRNLIAAKLPRMVKLIKNWNDNPFQMVQEINESFDALMMIGYHARAGVADSPLAHTMTLDVASILINDRPASEFLIFAYAAALKHVPLVFLSGDEGVCREVASVNPHIRTFAVKTCVGKSTINIHPEAAVEGIRESARQALSGDIGQCHIALPDRFCAEVTYKRSYDAYRCGFYPGAEMTGPFTVTYQADNYDDLLRCFLFIL